MTEQTSFPIPAPFPFFPSHNGWNLTWTPALFEHQGETICGTMTVSREDRGGRREKKRGLLLLLLGHFSRVRLCATVETAAHQAPLSLGFSRQKHWSGLPFPSPMHENEK